MQAEGLEHDVETPSDAVVEMPYAHHARADQHKCQGGDYGCRGTAKVGRQGIGQGFQGKPKHTGAGEFQWVKHGNIRQRRRLERRGEIGPQHPTGGGKGAQRQGEMLINGLMPSEKCALALRMENNPHRQRHDQP